jgi:hypothetical protein
MANHKAFRDLKKGHGGPLGSHGAFLARRKRMSEKVQLRVTVSKRFYGMVQRIAGSLGWSVGEYSLQVLASAVESNLAAGEDVAMQGGGAGEIVCDPQLLVLARGSKKKAKRFLTFQETQALLDRFEASMDALEAPPARQEVGTCQVINLATRRMKA